MRETKNKLSRLQWFILRQAGRRSILYYGEILELFFGWIPAQDSQPHRFSRKQVGESNYRKVMASLSRSCRRLQERGLVIRIHDSEKQIAGVILTESARRLVSSISDPLVKFGPDRAEVR